MTVEKAFQEADSHMKQAIEHMVHDFASYRTGRASPAVLDRVHVDYYGTESPINQVATVSIPEPRQLLIQPYDKSMTPVIERAILKSDLGINPVNDGTGIRLTFPAMTEETRKAMAKQVHSRAEEARIAIRNIRRHTLDHLKQLQKDKAISEDELKTNEAKVQKITDSFVAQIDDLMKKKEAELMQV